MIDIRGDMMHINLEADYAVRIVYCLTVGGRRMDAAEIAVNVSVTPRFTLKILRKLLEKNIVKSFKGAKGGYELALPPEKISMRMVVEAVEGPYVFSRCLNEDYSCTRAGAGGCPFYKVFDDISVIVRQRLEETTFDKLSG